MMHKPQILRWLVVLLVVMNVVTIGTIVYHNYHEQTISDKDAFNTGKGGNVINGRFLKQQLGFNEDQMNKFRQYNQQFRPFAMNITRQIDSIKADMFNELQSTNPDTTMLNQQSKKIGELHGNLKYETYQFYMQLKNICMPEQRKQLELAFRPLFINEELGFRFNQGRNKRGNEKESN